jgi:hypothetical protein
MSTSAEQTSLEDLFHRALDASSKVINMPSIEDETQVRLGYSQLVTPLIALYDRNLPFKSMTLFYSMQHGYES